MNKSAPVIEIFLQPGEFYFGDRYTRIRTLLGSCVAITLWHSRLQIGGMCHYMLPERTHKKPNQLDGKYADEAMQLFMHEVRQAGTVPAEYEAKLFGGGHMFTMLRKKGVTDVPFKNIEAGRALLAQHGFRVQAEDMGGDGYRQIIFEAGSGAVWVRHNAINRFQASENK
jgi:chemotaxis protein CheD